MKIVMAVTQQKLAEGCIITQSIDGRLKTEEEVWLKEGLHKAEYANQGNSWMHQENLQKKGVKNKSLKVFSAFIISQ